MDAVRKFLFGDGTPHPSEGIPRESREAHHRLMNTAMEMRKVSSGFDKRTDDILEVLARDIKRREGGGESP